MNRKIILLVLLASFSLTSCATLFGGQVTSCQRNKPKEGEAPRKIRVVPFVLDVFFWPSLIVDFSTKAIYKPCEEKYK